MIAIYNEPQYPWHLKNEEINVPIPTGAQAVPLIDSH
jgi:hypothetical protein